MSYWWESTRDLIKRLRRLMGRKPKIIIGGIYPSIAPEHALRYTGADIVVAGEVHAANDLWTDLSVYKSKPTYAIITPSRGCPFNCHYCAAKTVNGGIQKVRFRLVEDIFNEMFDKYSRYCIRQFCILRRLPTYSLSGQPHAFAAQDHNVEDAKETLCARGP